MPVQMPLAQLPDLALKQLVDSTRVFKELVRTQRALDALGGSMFWKVVGEYEYLAQRSGRQTRYLTRRSAAAEQQLEAFRMERDRLRARATSLSAAVDVAQRMNKAVRTGGVSTASVEILRQLASSALANRTLVLGPLAMQAYAQSAGLGVDPDQLPLALLVELSRAEAGASLHALVVAVSRWARLSHASFDPALGLLIVLEPIDAASPGRVKRQRGAVAVMDPMLVRQLRVLRDAPEVEHVLIARTGKMACLRTTDPAAFALVARQRRSASAPVIDQMLREHMLVSQWSRNEYQQAEQQLQGIEAVPGLAIA